MSALGRFGRFGADFFSRNRDRRLREKAPWPRLMAAAAGLLVGIWGQAANADAFPPPMQAPGQFAVNSTGGATYTIPIVIPPGTAGMTPSLSLVYSSQSGDGLLGFGWSLSGLPAITRCPRTVAQDGVHGGVNYDNNDRFCLDGKRLMVISGTY